MSLVMHVVRFWYDFVVGDDWMVAVAVVLGLVTVNLLVRVNTPAWWLLPFVVIAVLGVSLMRAARS